MDKKVVEFFERYTQENVALVCNDTEQTIFVKKNEAYCKRFCEEAGHSYKTVERPGTTTAVEVSAAKPVNKMNKTELSTLATELGVVIPEGATNKEIVALIEDAQANSTEAASDDASAEEGKEVSEGEDFEPTNS
jgi:hypothetical protein